VIILVQVLAYQHLDYFVQADTCIGGDSSSEVEQTPIVVNAAEHST